MSKIEEILQYNRAFVEKKAYETYHTTKYPNKKIAILTCMDTRLTELLPAALNLQNGDVKMIKNAGALITNPFGSVMRSLIVAIYELGVQEILVINHYDCGMQNLDVQALVGKMTARGVDPAQLALMQYLGVDMHRWLKGFEKPDDSVRETIKTIRTHPLVPQDVAVYGFLMDPVTGRMDAVAP